MTTLIDQARVALLERLDPKGVSIPLISKWIKVRPSNSIFSLRDVVKELGSKVPVGALSLALSELAKQGILEEFLRVEVNGKQIGPDYQSLADVPNSSVESFSDEESEPHLIPWYRLV